MKRNTAKSFIQVDNNLVRVTKFLFLPGDETTMHKHNFDYIVTPITDGELLLVDKQGIKSNHTLKSTETYFRKAGIEHNVINNGNSKLIFIETELKNTKKED